MLAVGVESGVMGEMDWLSLGSRACLLFVLSVDGEGENREVEGCCNAVCVYWHVC